MVCYKDITCETKRLMQKIAQLAIEFLRVICNYFPFLDFDFPFGFPFFAKSGKSAFPMSGAYVFPQESLMVERPFELL